MQEIQAQKEKVEQEVEKLEAMGGTFRGRMTRLRESAFARFPVVFVLLSSFGLVATFYGFEKIIDNTKFFANNPITILITGILILVFTGTLYKKLN